jgi:BirA family biotin operon repressor/biotin-[acetyl-CoA-carboxylase] ligase
MTQQAPPKFYFASLDSTNSKARELAEQGAVSGTLVWAGEQTAGRGRLGKSWHSETGKGLFCSLVLRPQVALDDLAKTTMVCGVALGELLQRLAGKRVGLKWPNDILFENKKCAGILVEASPLSGGCEPFLIVGIGINVNQQRQDFPEELQEQATSLLVESGRSLALEPLLDALRDELLNAIHLFEAKGFSSLLGRWRTMDCLKGKQLEAVNTLGQVVKGISLGPDEQGILYLQADNGSLHQVLSGDVRLADQLQSGGEAKPKDQYR